MDDSLVLSYDLPTSPARAFSLYVNQIGQWWPGTFTDDPATFQNVVIEPRVGGRVYACYRNGEARVWGSVLVLEPGRTLEHTFSLGSVRTDGSSVRLEFTEHEMGSRLTFRHRHATLDNPMARHRFSDWPAVLALYIDCVRAASKGS